MSIYGSTLSFDGEDWGDENSSPAPIRYRGSHVYPDPNDRGGSFDLGVIPGHIGDGGGYDDAHEHWFTACHRPFLRVSFSDDFCYGYPDGTAPASGTIVLDAAQVLELRDELTDWLARISGPDCTVDDPEEVKASMAALVAKAGFPAATSRPSKEARVAKD